MPELGQKQTSAPTSDYVCSEPVSGRVSGASQVTAKGQKRTFGAVV